MSSFAFPTGFGKSDTRKGTGQDYKTITGADIARMVEAPQQAVAKDRAQWFIPSTYHAHDARDHGPQLAHGAFPWLTVDVDDNNLALEDVTGALDAVLGPCRCLIHTTSSATAEERKWRVLVPLSSPLTGGDYLDTQAAFHALLEDASQGLLIPCDSLRRAGQLIYLPNNRTGFYQSHVVRDAPRLDLPAGHPIIAGRDQDRAARAEAEREAEARRKAKAAERAARQSTGDDVSPIDAFNDRHDVAALLASYGYLQQGASDHWRSPMQSTKSFATRCYGEYWTSLSSSDDAAGIGAATKTGARFGDAFDLYCYFDHGGDMHKAVAAYGAEMRQSEPPPTGYDAGWTPKDDDDSEAECPPPNPDEFYQSENTPPKADSDPVDLWGSFAPPDLPQGLLPRLLDDFARINGDQMGADPAGLAVAALVTCAAAIPDKIKIKVKRHADWTESARLWAALVGPPSAKKSPIISAATGPLCRLDGALMRDWQRRMHEWNNTPKDDRTGPAPLQERLRIEDTTVEAAQQVLEGSPDGVLCLQDELSGFFGAMDKYNGGKGASADRAFWLKSFNGGEFALNRVGRGAGIIDNLSVSMLGGIQPEPLRKIAGDSVDDGLLQRLFPILLRNATMGRDEAMPPINDRYRALIEALHNLPAPGWMGQGVLEFSSEAQAIRRDLEERHLQLQTVETINRKLASHIGKYDGLFARLCVVWHCVEHVEKADAGEMRITVDANLARRVADFLHGFLLRHAFAFYSGTLGLSDDHDRLRAIAGAP